MHPTLRVALMAALFLPLARPAEACSSFSGHPVAIYPARDAVVAPGAHIAVITGGYDLGDDLSVTVTTNDGDPVPVAKAGVFFEGPFVHLHVFEPQTPLGPGTYRVDVDYPEPADWVPDPVADETVFHVQGDLPTPSAVDPPSEITWYAVEYEDVVTSSCGAYQENANLWIGPPAADGFLWYEIEIDATEGAGHAARIHVPRAFNPNLQSSPEDTDPTTPSLTAYATQFDAGCLTITTVDLYGNRSEALTTCKPTKCVLDAPADDIFYLSTVDWEGIAGCEPPTAEKPPADGTPPGNDDEPSAGPAPSSAACTAGAGSGGPAAAVLLLGALVLLGVARRRPIAG